jgi:aryl-alcohol dehydrogenase-like predicted oxidoreductase
MATRAVLSGHKDPLVRVKPFGRTSLAVSEFGLGCARIGGVFQGPPAQFAELLTQAFDSGITFFDTADMYSQGESEKLIGKTFRKRRDRIVIASKAGYVLPSQRRVVARIKPFLRPVIRLLRVARRHVPGAVRGALSQDFTPGYLENAVESSLRRLRTDYLDLLQLHSPPAAVVAAGEWLPALERLQRQGKIRYYGISCDTVDAAREALRFPGVSSLQLPLSLLERAAVDVLADAHGRGVAVIAREALANGLLVKESASLDVRVYCRSDQEAEEKSARLEQLRAEAGGQGLSLPRLALDYVSGLPGVTVTLLGASRPAQLAGLLRELSAPVGSPSIPRGGDPSPIRS